RRAARTTESHGDEPLRSAPSPTFISRTLARLPHPTTRFSVYSAPSRSGEMAAAADLRSGAPRGARSLHHFRDFGVSYWRQRRSSRRHLHSPWLFAFLPP